MAFTVGELSKLTGVTVRALHHYDEIGLVRPSQRTRAGYRLYADADVLRLQQVLVLRELGVALDEIGPAIDEAGAAGTAGDRAALLRKHRAQLADKRRRLDAMLAAVDAALEVLEKAKQTMTPEDWKTMFDGFDPADHEAEARARWGDTDAYQESARRTRQYGKPDWEAIRKESDEIHGRLARLMQQGAAASDPAVQAAVEDHRKHIERWFYPCSSQLHKGLGEMYVADPRFTASLDKKAGEGFARFFRDAISASP